MCLFRYYSHSATHEDGNGTRVLRRQTMRASHFAGGAGLAPVTCKHHSPQAYTIPPIRKNQGQPREHKDMLEKDLFWFLWLLHHLLHNRLCSPSLNWLNLWCLGLRGSLRFLCFVGCHCLMVAQV